MNRVVISIIYRLQHYNPCIALRNQPLKVFYQIVSRLDRHVEQLHDSLGRF